MQTFSRYAKRGYTLVAVGRLYQAIDASRANSFIVYQFIRPRSSSSKRRSYVSKIYLLVPVRSNNLFETQRIYINTNPNISNKLVHLDRLVEIIGISVWHVSLLNYQIEKRWVSMTRF
jgi:hypothetical protein